VSVAMPAHHPIDIGHPGKRTFRHRAAAAVVFGGACRHRFALPRGLEVPARLTAPQPLAQRFAAVNRVLIESDKVLDLPKAEVWRAQPGKPAHCMHDVFIATIATVLPAALSACWLSQGQRHDGRKAFHP